MTVIQEAYIHGVSTRAVDDLVRAMGLTLALDDPDRLAVDCTAARGYGMAGKLCIHPRQVAGVETGFRPTEAKIAEARRLLTTAEEAGDRGAVRLDGKLVDRARRTLEQADP